MATHRVDVPTSMPLTSLTKRERQIKRMVCEGQINKAIARKLSISEGAVKVHIHHIFEKLAIHNRTALAGFTRPGRGGEAEGSKVITHRMVKASGGKYVGTRVDKPAESEAEHFMPCPNCGVPLEVRDLGQVFEHDTPLHIEQGRRKNRATIKAARSAKSVRARKRV
jgi:DNA-binding CsgD family transcriptional regulator